MCLIFRSFVSLSSSPFHCLKKHDYFTFQCSILVSKVLNFQYLHYAKGCLQTNHSFSNINPGFTMAEDKLIRNRKMGLIKKQSNVFKIRRNSLLLFSIIFLLGFIGLFVRRLGEPATGLDVWREDEWGAQFLCLAEECHRVSAESMLTERMLMPSMTYFIIKRAVGCFFHCALPLLIPDFDDHHWVNVLTHQLAGLSDGYGNLQHKVACTHSGPGCWFTRELGEAGYKESVTYLIVLRSDLPIMDLSQQFWSMKRKFNIFISSSKNML